MSISRIGCRTRNRSRARTDERQVGAENAWPANLAPGVVTRLQESGHATELERCEGQQEHDGRNDRKLDDRCTPSLFSARLEGVL